jgi:hypothetical protein
MTITSKPSAFVKIPYNDPRFIMTDGIAQCNIAGIEIHPNCPLKHQNYILEAMNNGWLIPFAMIKQEMDYCI